MEHSGRPLAVSTESLEERRTVTLGDAGEDGEVQLECALACVEHPIEVMAHRSSDLLDGDFGHEIQVDLGTDLGQAWRQDLRTLIGGVVREIV